MEWRLLVPIMGVVAQLGFASFAWPIGSLAHGSLKASFLHSRAMEEVVAVEKGLWAKGEFEELKEFEGRKEL